MPTAAMQAAKVTMPPMVATATMAVILLLLGIPDAVTVLVESDVVVTLAEVDELGSGTVYLHGNDEHHKAEKWLKPTYINPSTTMYCALRHADTVTVCTVFDSPSLCHTGADTTISSCPGVGTMPGGPVRSMQDPTSPSRETNELTAYGHKGEK
jgi:hypothetical protein